MKIPFLKNVGSFFVTTLLTFTAIAADYEARVVFDVGSGSTKMNLYRVSTATKKFETLSQNQKNISLDVVEPILKDLKNADGKSCLNAKVDYRDDQKKNGGIFSEAIMTQGLAALKAMKTCALEGLKNFSSLTGDTYGVIRYVGVATSAFRSFKEKDAPKAAAFIDRIKQETGISVSIIDHKVEGFLGTVAAVTTKNVPFKNVMVWDVGGGSWQASLVDDQGIINVISQDQRASVDFLNAVLTATGKTKNPNPFNNRDYRIAADLAKEWTQENEAKHVKKILREKKITTVIATGGVHARSVLPKINEFITDTKNDKKYTFDNLGDLIHHFIQTSWNKQEDFAESVITNAILIEAYMHAWNIDLVDVADANLTEGFSRNLSIDAWNTYMGVTHTSTAITKPERYKDY